MARQVAEHGGGVAALVEGDVDDLAQLRARLVLVAEALESLVVGVESAAVGPQGEEQHPGEALLGGGQVGIARTIAEEMAVGVRSAGVVDVGDGTGAAGEFGPESVSSLSMSPAPRRSEAHPLSARNTCASSMPVTSRKCAGRLSGERVARRRGAASGA